MKIISLLFCFCIAQSTLAFYESLSLGVGTYTEAVGEIEEDIETNDTNTFDFKPFVKASFIFDGIWTDKILWDVALSFPSEESSESDATRMNVWTNLLGRIDFEYTRPYYGIGLYFTRIAMDGNSKIIDNGGQPVEFQSPAGAFWSSNTVITVGTDTPLSDILSLNTQAMVLNIEDSTERAFNYFLSFDFKTDL